MKKFILVFAILLSSNLIFAQKNSLSLGYGLLSTDQVAFTYAMLFTSIAGEMAGSGSQESAGFFGPLVISYHRTLDSNERISFGGSLTIDHAKFIDKDTKNDAYSFNAFTLAPEGKFKYLDPQSKFNLYGLLGLGGTMIVYKNQQSGKTGAAPHFNLQFSPLGIEYGENVKGFLELGIGYKGLISGGVTYRF